MMFTTTTTVIGLVALITASVQAAAVAGDENTFKPCTSTLTRLGHFGNLGPTSTYYKKTATATVSVDCHGCGVLSILTKPIGVGPVVHYTTTVTKPATTTTTTVCTPSIR